MTLLESKPRLCLSLPPGIFCFLPIPFVVLSSWYVSSILYPSFFQPFPIISFSSCLSPGESWLDITAQDLERMLQERSGGRADVGSQNTSSTRRIEQHVRGAEETRKEAEDKEGEGEGEEEAGYSLVAVSQGMKNFLNAMSSHEGAELPW